MDDEPTFEEFIRRVRAGDADAAAELVRKYEAVVRLEVKMRMTDPRLRRVVDTMDVCQSVLAGFFVGAAAGQYDLNGPADLVRLLVTIARNKVVAQARRHRASRRDVRRGLPLDPAVFDPADAGPTPSQVVVGEDLLREFRGRMTDEERELADRRARGESWEEVAAGAGGTPQGRRKQLERAVARVSRELGLDSENEPADD